MVSGSLVIPSGIVISGFLTLVTAVIYFHKKTADKLENCETNHQEANEKLFNMNGRLERLEGTIAGKEAGVELVVEAVIKEVNKLKD